MPSITLQFAPEMRQAIREGRKVCTTRSKILGEVGDLFVVAGRAYRIVDISPYRLADVRDQLFLQEGCESADEFVVLWRHLHQGDFSADKTYFVHWFARVDAEGNAWLQVVKAPDFCPPQHDDGCPGSDCCECGERCVRVTGRRDAR